MKKFFLKHCMLYRWLVSKLFWIPHQTRLSIPWNIYGDFDVHYLGYDKDGNVQKGFKNIIEAVKNRGNLGLTVVYDKY